MLQYPSIKSWKNSVIGKPCIAFYKYDGSNLRWEWQPKKGWFKYGTRTQLFDKNTPLYNQSIELFNDTIGPVVASTISQITRSKTERIVAFTEFFGESSFAGTHDFDEEKILKLFDVSIYKKGFIPPRQFLELFGDFDFCAKAVYEGNMSNQFINDVKMGMYPVYEGVICKGVNWSAKIKTLHYLQRLKNTNPQQWEQEKNE